MDYPSWLKLKSLSENRDVSKDAENYDIERYQKESGAAANQSGHSPDTYKKPNHPTFSQESIYSNPLQQGGVWSQEGKFTPSALNLKNMPADEMQSYFNEVESPEALDLPADERVSKARREVLQKMSR